MNKTAIFSISTNDFVGNAKVAIESFMHHNKNRNNIDTYNISLKDIEKKLYTNIYIDRICFRYKENSDVLRWALKPAFFLHFLQDKNYDNVIYIDNDIYFVNDNTFLIDLLDRGILLTKHNRFMYPSSDEKAHEEFLCNFVHGFINAGFVGASKLGLPALEWWLKMNLWQCCKNNNYGLYDDQKYLDILGLEFNNLVRICEHPGCNLARWNTYVAVRSFVDGKWKINNTYDPIFCHFSGTNNIIEDPLLSEFKQEYKNKLASQK